MRTGTAALLLLALLAQTFARHVPRLVMGHMIWCSFMHGRDFGFLRGTWCLWRRPVPGAKPLPEGSRSGSLSRKGLRKTEQLHSISRLKCNFYC